MKPIFNIDEKYDICLLPYSPVRENDRVEIRAQVFNSGLTGDVKVNFYLNSDYLQSKILSIPENSYGLANVFLDLSGKVGKHSVVVTLETENGEIINSKACIPLEVISDVKPVLDGGFVMLGPPNDRKPCDTYRNELKAFTDENWNEFISEMFSIGMDCVIINVCHQYLTLEKRELTAHYPSEILPKSDITADDPISAILHIAETENKKVFIGVGNQFGHKGTIDEMTELYNRYKHFKSFYGWYFATELRMDISEKVPFEKWNLYNYLYEAAHKLCPVKPILISPMGMPSEKFAERFKEIKFCDIIMPQDWVGQCAFRVEDSQTMYHKLYEICKDSKIHLWANCEAFNFTDTPDGKWENWGCTFKDFRWDAPRVLVPRFRGGGMVGEQGFDRQMKVVRPYTEKIMAFMLSGFFCPENFKPVCGGEAAIKQYKEYISYLKKISEENK